MMGRLIAIHGGRVVGHLALACAVLSVTLPLSGQSQSGTTLSLKVLPEIRMEAAAASAWTDLGGMEETAIPLKVMVRFNGGTNGKLKVSMPTISEESAGSLRILTETGPQDLGSVPVVVKLYAQSGVYDDVLRIQRPVGASTPLPASLEIRLSSSDGGIDGITVVSLPMDSPSAT